MANLEAEDKFLSVYGPVVSWRYGKSLGIDPIGATSTCSFNCVYCQLGEIEKITRDRSLFVPTAKIIEDLKSFAPWDVDIITLSGSGEPTLALNLGEILQEIKALTGKPTLVLTNATLLHDPQVRQELALADKVSVKLDGISEDLFKRINRPQANINLAEIIQGIEEFKTEFLGQLSLQTMVLSDWSEDIKNQYINLIKRLNPDKIQLNTPSRPKPLKRELEGRGNTTAKEEISYPVQVIKCVSPEILQSLAEEINQKTSIPIQCSPSI
jgi:wyosine [tRNA(Phe)-imidazoG37] synthetase (radical SAM superfamily)